MRREINQRSSRALSALCIWLVLTLSLILVFKALEGAATGEEGTDRLLAWAQMVSISIYFFALGAPLRKLGMSVPLALLNFLFALVGIGFFILSFFVFL